MNSNKLTYTSVDELKSALSKEIGSAIEDYDCYTKDIQLLLHHILKIVRKIGYIPEVIENHLLKSFEDIFVRHAPIDCMERISSFQCDIVEFIMNMFDSKRIESPKKPFTNVTPWDYLKHIMDSVSEGMHESHYYFRHDVEHSPAETLYRELIRLVITNSKEDTNSVIESIVNLKDPNFPRRFVVDTAGRIGCLYNNVNFLITHKDSIFREEALHHAVLSKSDKVFYYLLGNIDIDTEELSSIKMVLGVAVGLDRLEYVKHMYAHFGNKTLCGRLYYAIAKSKEMKEFLRQY